VRAARQLVDKFIVGEFTAPQLAQLRGAYRIIQGSEAYAVHTERLVSDLDGYDVEVRERLRAGSERLGSRCVAPKQLGGVTEPGIRSRTTSLPVVPGMFNRWLTWSGASSSPGSASGASTGPAAGTGAGAGGEAGTGVGEADGLGVTRAVVLGPAGTSAGLVAVLDSPSSPPPVTATATAITRITARAGAPPTSYHRYLDSRWAALSFGLVGVAGTVGGGGASGPRIPETG
jgi:aspartyl-tRNA(Asn)/glutamyl-tRNA(Gln) amidotransferase subunit A